MEGISLDVDDGHIGIADLLCILGNGLVDVAGDDQAREIRDEGVPFGRIPWIEHQER